MTQDQLVPEYIRRRLHSRLRPVPQRVTERPSSPALIPFGETVQLVVSSAGSVAGYEPQSGMRLWEFGEVGGNTSTTPVAAGDGLFLISASAGSEGGNAEEAKKSNGLMAVPRLGEE